MLEFNLLLIERSRLVESMLRLFQFRDMPAPVSPRRRLSAAQRFVHAGHRNLSFLS